jgi:hypothetical protein
VRDANVFRDSQASIETPNLTFTIPFLSSYERGTMSGEVWSLTCEIASKELANNFRNSFSLVRSAFCNARRLSTTFLPVW